MGLKWDRDNDFDHDTYCPDVAGFSVGIDQYNDKMEFYVTIEENHPDGDGMRHELTMRAGSLSHAEHLAPSKLASWLEEMRDLIGNKLAAARELVD